mmetsp:Transcript_86007/g.271160  ORF Transcript_86007/g.271160 Transcript_86007/m.271160 type:complete len:153 (+) Transcript_86007:766-1224(+)
MELAHFRGCPNLSFLELDVTRSDAGPAIAAAAARAPAGEAGGPQALVLVGMHLCGALSVHAARLFLEAPAPSALVLAPCCLDTRQPEVKRRARRLGVDPHLYWCISLLINVLPGGPGHRRELLVDDSVMSAKNSFLIATSVGRPTPLILTAP